MIASRILVTLGALALLLVLSVAPVRAGEGDIVVLSDDVVSQFPDGISFNLSLESPNPIDDIRVYYKSEGAATTSYGRVEFEPGTIVQGHFFLDTSVGSEGGNAAFIPPGTVFRYSYEVFNQAGEVMRTEEKEYVYTDSRFEWTPISDGPITVYYYGPTETRAKSILQASLEATTNMARVLGLNDIGHINIIAYNNYRHMVTALPPRAQSVREGLITQGQAFTDLRVLLVLATDPSIEGIASHEVTHVLVDDAAGRAYSIIPAWLNEGLAEFGNVAPSESYDNALLYGIYTRRLKPLPYLTSFTGDPDDVVISYGHSRSVVSYLINTYGEGKMAELIAQLEHTFSLDDAFTIVYGFDQGGLDDEWRSRMGLRPFSTGESDGVVAQPTAEPTPLPAVDSTPDVQQTGTPMPREDDEEAAQSPGCNRGSRTNASVPVDPFFFLLMVGPLGLWPLRRLRKPKI